MSFPKSGFTLVELLVVVVIISVLSSVAVGVVPAATARAKKASFAATLAVVQSACDRFFAETNRYPCTIQPGPNSAQPIDYAQSDGTSENRPFVGGYLQFPPNANAVDFGLSPGTLRYFVAGDGRVFAAKADSLTGDTVVYTQDNVEGRPLLSLIPGFQSGS